MADKGYSIGIDVKTVKSVNISRYADGYNYASVSCKMADKEYMSVHYEWQGKSIPEFAMQTMEIMKALGMEKASIEVESSSVEYLERASKVIAETAAKMKKKDEEEEDDKKDKKMPFEKKDKKDKKEAKKKKDC